MHLLTRLVGLTIALAASTYSFSAAAMPPRDVYLQLCGSAIAYGHNGFWWEGPGGAGSEWVSCENYGGEPINVYGDAPDASCPPGCGWIGYPYGGCDCTSGWVPSDPSEPPITGDEASGTSPRECSQCKKDADDCIDQATKFNLACIDLLAGSFADSQCKAGIRIDGSAVTQVNTCDTCLNWICSPVPHSPCDSREVNEFCGGGNAAWNKIICVDQTMTNCLNEWIEGVEQTSTASTQTWSVSLTAKLLESIGAGATVGGSTTQTITFSAHQGLRGACTALATSDAAQCAIKENQCKKEKGCPDEKPLRIPPGSAISQSDIEHISPSAKIDLREERQPSETDFARETHLKVLQTYRDFEATANLSPEQIEQVRRILADAQENALFSMKLQRLAVRHVRNERSTQSNLNRVLRRIAPTTNRNVSKPPNLDWKFSVIDAKVNIALSKVLSEYQYAEFKKRFPFWASPFAVSQPFAIYDPSSSVRK